MTNQSLVCFDLETTSADPKTAEVVQVAAVKVELPSWREVDSREMVCKPAGPIPPASIEVHGITDEQVKDAPGFHRVVRSLLEFMGDATAVVTFNGARFDITIVERYAQLLSTSWRWSSPHIDVWRLWMRDKALGASIEHTYGGGHGGAVVFHADEFSGSLAGCHRFYTGERLKGAHDALKDVQGTLRCLRASGLPEIEAAVKLSSEPLPGDVDFDGKFRWVGGEVVFGFGKHRGTPVREQLGYLRWVTKGDFSEETKRLARELLAGRYPREGSRTQR